MRFIKSLRSFFLVLLASLLLIPLPLQAAEKQTVDDHQIHALSAVLLDGDSGRVLYEKEGDVKRANASTTKIMTCILALENGCEDDVVTVSVYAASMPNVQLNIKEGEQYYLKDLLYSLMLESHNDSAVAIAEHISGSVDAFHTLMNEKAKSLGCENTYFLTPNGLDATEGENTHGTSAKDLARIMRYCVWSSQESARFLEITQTASHNFSNLLQKEDGSFYAGDRNFTCTNHNAYLQQNPDCLSGKTGFTSDAGYCYVTALASGERKFVIALLASGWPNNKNYKWQDCNLLYQYAKAHFQMRQMDDLSKALRTVQIKGAQNEAYDLSKTCEQMPYIKKYRRKILLADWENISLKLSYPKNIKASGKGARAIGTATCLVEDACLETYDILVKDDTLPKNLPWFFLAVVKKWALFF